MVKKEFSIKDIRTLKNLNKDKLDFYIEGFSFACHFHDLPFIKAYMHSLLQQKKNYKTSAMIFLQRAKKTLDKPAQL